jgi:transcription-repair coupling factor (superfamily II helicase)
VDIVIGTHRLLSFDVHFKDLGLLIVDEEQRFGVKHKERLKRLRADIDILTMTATPIPRTLYMSLAGLRDLSTIVTPPQERLPVQTVVAQYDETLIVEAIRRELQREGQVFYLHNRVQTIEKTAARLHALIPEARIRIAHGQMAEGELEAAMLSFIDGQEDVLLCTTIIESGVDIPNTNTIIIERADMFGLAELYQLRGRVGRYHRQAYAYLLIPRQGILLDNARKRLAAIRKYTQLGAGFKLALRDLEIRGAGNILGAEQSGHIAAIGFDLYCQLLREAVSRLKQQPLTARPTAPLDLDFVVFGQSHDAARVSACIPHEYLREETLRVGLYRRLSEAGTLAALDDLAAEIADRFGAPPPEVQALLQVMRVRVLAHQAGVHAVTVRDGKVMLESAAGYLKDHQRLMPRLTAKTPPDRLAELVAIIARYTPRQPLADRASA